MEVKFNYVLSLPYLDAKCKKADKGDWPRLSTLAGLVDRLRPPCYTAAMRRSGITVLFIASMFGLLFSPAAARQGSPTGAEILSPQAGEVIQGNARIVGTAAGENFSAWELAFGYAGDPTLTWFLIAGGNEPVSQDTLADWDTTTLTDGTYDLRLLVTRIDGSQVTAVTGQVRVRNYTPAETSTPTLAPTSAPQPTSTPTLTQTPTATRVPLTPTPLPTNPAVVSRADLREGALLGVLGAVFGFAVLGLYLSARRVNRS